MLWEHLNLSSTADQAGRFGCGALAARCERAGVDPEVEGSAGGG